MGYLDYAGLQYLWGKLKEKFAPKSHTHDDRYYTEAEMDGKLTGKSNTDHTHNSIKDAGDGRTLTLAYSKSGLDYGSYSWLAGWNGKELRAVNKNQFATAYHTHTKSQITDFPASLKNPTALTIQTNGTTAAIYDGSAAKTVNITKSNIGLGNVDNTADANKSVKYATSAGLATNAQCLNNDDKYMKFHWSGQKGQPTWLWGGNDSGDMYVYNPSNFNVNYATTAGNGTVGFQTKVTTDGYFGAVRFGNGVQICWFTMKSTRNRTFLLPFADINYAIAFSGGYCWLDINNRTTTGFTVGVEWSGYENSYIAIGRWK